ncbi:TcpQ domain-containing protein [Xanthomonas perforans]|uniref:TcpQ domain-containing protein n=1 Tax=Xanthomonas perforans TaxID=442694 RepID=UPI00235964BA|nr:TcpQ domain-containing protein [Xanthomonas perforans]MDC9654342.1 TcpQ domain-containing protein [Xanthomonas perforans]MEB2158977.1 TcpQ domain-containing protein [Xanthomonas campestris pv. campestris]
MNDPTNYRRVLFGAALFAVAGLALADDASRRCLETVKPVIRNADGSISPNPAFDACLVAPITPPAPARKPVVVTPSLQQPTAKVVSGGTTASTTAAPPVKSEPLPPPKPKWTAGNGEWISAVLQGWAAKAKWTVAWESPGADWQVVGNLTFEGEFIDAARGALAPYVKAGRIKKPDVYPDQSVIVVQEH